MKFYVVGRNASPTNPEHPSFYLRRDTWDDYSSKTLFHLVYAPAPGPVISIGQVKFMNTAADGYDTAGYVQLPAEFVTLESYHFSLGQDLNFYTTVQRILGDQAQATLNAINDVATQPGLLEEVETSSVFKSSLIRFSEAEKALGQARRVLLGLPIDANFQFTFACKVGAATAPHEATFNFSGDSILPERVMAIVGNNGTGKTQFLSKMALVLSGEEGGAEPPGEFNPSRPPFSKIIAVSYSAFDKFERPKKNRTFSYIYCGLKDTNGFLTAKKLESRYGESIAKIESAAREIIWWSVLKNIIDEDKLEVIRGQLFDQKLFAIVAHNSEGFLSSGQSVLLYVMTEILANIRDESLILFDEPEMHLHPNAIAKLIKMINVVLDRFNSYAILATHSPIILQEIPAKCVRVFEREGSTPWVRALDIESFGENLTTITKNVFETVNTKANYKETLELLAQKYSYDEVQALFAERLSMNASIYLRGLYPTPA